MSSVALSWSGGKDSALALRVLREELDVEPNALLTTFTTEYDRVSMHGVRRELVQTQAEAAGVPLVAIELPASCDNEQYDACMARALAAPPLEASATIAFADLFLADIRTYREQRLRAAGRRGLFPLWGQDTRKLAQDFIDRGFAATVVCVDLARLERSFAGRSFDRSLLADLPADVDPCGENGEFHTFVHAGPIFASPIAIEHGEIVVREGYAFQDLLPG